MARRKWKRIAALALAAVITLEGAQTGQMPQVSAAQEESGSVQMPAAGETFSVERLTSNYTKISANYTAPVYGGEQIRYAMDEILDEAYSDRLAADNRGYDNGVVDMHGGDTVSVTLTVPQTGLYWMGFDYLSYDSSILPIEFAMMIDGGYPFYETRNLTFETTWVSEEDVELDRYGNEIVSLPDKKIQWESKYLMDASYRYSEPLLVEIGRAHV